MESLRWIGLSDDEIDAFLGDGGTGVLSLGTDADEPPYSLPVSYGYDRPSRHLHFQLSVPEEGGKTPLLGRPVSFVTYGETEDGYRSVVATGHLEDLTDLPPDAAAVQERWGIDLPVLEAFEDAPEELAVRQFRLVPEQLTGRREVESED